MLCLIENKVSRFLFTNVVSGSEPPEFHLTLQILCQSYLNESASFPAQKQSYLSQVEIKIQFQIIVPASSVQIPKILHVQSTIQVPLLQVLKCSTSSCVNSPGAKWTSHTAEVKSTVAMHHQSKDKMLLIGDEENTVPCTCTSSKLDKPYVTQ